MIRVLIVCSWGMSTSLLVDSMLAAAQERGCELSVEALSAGEYAERVDDCDVVLIAPQIRHLRKSIEKLAASAGKPVALIEAFYYATMNGQAVFEQGLSLLPSEGKKAKWAARSKAVVACFEAISFLLQAHSLLTSIFKLCR